MSIAETSGELDVGYVEEASWGVLPGSPQFISLRNTGVNFGPDFSAKSSEAEVVKDGQVSDVTVQQKSSKGSVPFLLSFGEYDTHFEHLMRSAFTTIQTITGVDLSLSGSQLLSTANAFTSANNAVGQHIIIAGSATQANDGVYEITAFAVGALDLKKLDGTTAAFTADSSNASLKYASSKMLRNGTTKKSMAFELGNTGIAQFLLYKGNRVADFSLALADDSEISGTFNFQGKKLETPTQVTNSTGPLTASQTGKIMNANSHIANILEGGADVTSFWRNISLSINNNLSEATAVKNEGSVEVFYGNFKVSGSVEIYFEDVALLTKLLNKTATSLRVSLKDDDGNYFIFTVLNCKFTGFDQGALAANQPIAATLTFDGAKDTTTGKTFQVDMLAKL